MSSAKITLTDVKAAFMIGAASIVYMLSSLIKFKVAALALGPAGVGLIGVFQQLMQNTIILFSLGMRDAGTRQISSTIAVRNPSDIAAVRSALFWGIGIMATIAGIFSYISLEHLSKWIIGVEISTIEKMIMVLGIVISISAVSQQAILNGMQKRRELSIITATSGVLSAIVVVVALIVLNEVAIMIFIVSTPILIFVLGHFYVIRLPKWHQISLPYSKVVYEFYSMAALGAPIMFATFAVGVGHLTVRIIVNNNFGEEILGYFTAAWMISSYLIIFLYQITIIDFLPRITQALGKHEHACNLINNQMRLGLVFSAALFIFFATAAPFIISLLYSDDFVYASSALRYPRPCRH